MGEFSENFFCQKRKMLGAIFKQKGIVKLMAAIGAMVSRDVDVNVGSNRSNQRYVSPMILTRSRCRY